MIKIIKKHLPLFAAFGVFGVTMIVLFISSIGHNQGHFVYALDDPYIHMSLAKNFSQHGIWGINKYEFTSSSSSILWTSLLSLIYFLFGVNEISPFIINLIFGTFIIFEVYLLLRKYSLNLLPIFIVLLAIIFITPLPSLIFCGLEHTMHTFLTILFVYLSARILQNDKSTPSKNILLILAPFITSTRYEGLFLVFVVCILFVLRKRLVYSILLGSIAVIPLAIYAVISIRNGWWLLPNSVLLKGSVPSFSIEGVRKFFYHFCIQIVDNPHILILLSVGLFLLILQLNKYKSFWKDYVIMVFIYLAITLLHILFAQTGWFFRYEAYLVTLGIFVITIGIHEFVSQKLSIVFDRKLIPKYVAAVVLIFILFLPFGGRGAMSLFRIIRATTNIYEQQYQMGLFLHQFYQGESVAANDIGAISYLADINCLDLWGLGSSEVAKLKIDGSYTSQKIYEFAKQRKIIIAVVYDHWFEQYGGIPSSWIKVGKWKISNNVVCGEDTVSFYAVDITQKKKLIQNLRTFHSIF